MTALASETARLRENITQVRRTIGVARPNLLVADPGGEAALAVEAIALAVVGRTGGVAAGLPDLRA
jgi:hypothetical protein